MRPMSRIPAPVLLIAGLLIASPTLATTAKAPPKLTLESLPAAVQKTVKAETEGAVIHDISHEKGEDGKWVYEIETKVKDLGHDFIVGEDGTLLISERQVTIESLPAAVRTTLTKAAGKRPILIVESVTKAGKFEYYEAQVGSSKAPAEIKIGSNGAVVK